MEKRANEVPANMKPQIKLMLARLRELINPPADITAAETEQ